MTPAELAQRIAALDWSATSLQHQLAVSAAVTTLAKLESPPMQHDVDPNLTIARAPCNVVALPVRPRTCWTTLCHLDGREWARSSHFGPGGAWNWVLDCVREEHGVEEELIGCAESGEDDPYDCDDLVTIDGLPIYRIKHLSI